MLVACGLLAVYWQWIDYASWNPLGGVPITITGHAVTPTVAPGGNAVVQWEYTIHRDCPRRIELWVLDGVETLIASHRGSTSGDGAGKRWRSRAVPVPQGATGEVRIRSKGEFYCTPFKPWRYVYDVVVPVSPG